MKLIPITLPESIQADLNLIPLTRRLVIYDFETTGLSPEKDRPIQAAVIVIEKDGTASAGSCFIKAHKLLSDLIIQLTGITEDILTAEGLEYEDVMHEMAKIFRLLEPGTTHRPSETTLIGHNSIKFDWEFMKAFVLGKYIRPDDLRMFDTAGHFKAELLNMQKPKLEGWSAFHRRVLDIRAKGVKFNLALACEHYGVQADGAHRADADVLMTLGVFLKQCIKMQAPVPEPDKTTN